MTIEYQGKNVSIPTTIDSKTWKRDSNHLYDSPLTTTKVEITPGKTPEEDAVRFFSPEITVRGQEINDNSLCQKLKIHWSDSEQSKERNPCH
jgi:hypothetical protein